MSKDFTNLIKQSTRTISIKKAEKLLIKIIRIKNGNVYFNVKGDSFLMVKAPLSDITSGEFWVDEWYKISNFKNAIIIEADNTKDIEIKIIK